MRSDSTLVPPVTELRSPPDSRITGADSPVIADSSTLATPSTTSPSPGMTSPASTTTRSPSRSSVPGTASSVPSARSRRAIVSVLARRSVAACALPRPSATASARLANTTVSHSHTTTDHANTLGSTTASTVDSTAPTSTTNMTGLCTITRGSSLRTRGRQRGQQHLRVEQARLDPCRGVGLGGGHGGRSFG